MVASDGMPITGSKVHPRGQGTFSRVLGHYVREEKTLDLMTAIRKMTLLPAQRLEKRAPMFQGEGRIRMGADADITVFAVPTLSWIKRRSKSRCNIPPESHTSL